MAGESPAATFSPRRFGTCGLAPCQALLVRPAAGRVSAILCAMPYRRMQTLTSWIAEFVTAGEAPAGQIYVIQQDREDGRDEGLIAVTLMNASTATYVDPVMPDGSSWAVTFEPRETPEILTADQAAHLGADLMMMSRLCRFLEGKASELGRHAGAADDQYA